MGLEESRGNTIIEKYWPAGSRCSNPPKQPSAESWSASPLDFVT